MGHFYSKSTSDPKANCLLTNENIVMGIKIEKIYAKIENKATQVDERSSSVLKYRTPHFKFLDTLSHIFWLYIFIFYFLKPEPRQQLDFRQ